MKKVQMIVGRAGLGHPGEVIETSDKAAADLVRKGHGVVIDDDDDEAADEYDEPGDELTGSFGGSVPNTLDVQSDDSEEMNS